MKCTQKYRHFKRQLKFLQYPRAHHTLEITTLEDKPILKPAFKALHNLPA